MKKIYDVSIVRRYKVKPSADNIQGIKRRKQAEAKDSLVLPLKEKQRPHAEKTPKQSTKKEPLSSYMIDPDYLDYITGESTPDDMQPQQQKPASDEWELGPKETDGKLELLISKLSAAWGATGAVAKQAIDRAAELWRKHVSRANAAKYWSATKAALFKLSIATYDKLAVLRKKALRYLKVLLALRIPATYTAARGVIPTNVRRLKFFAKIALPVLAIVLLLTAGVFTTNDTNGTTTDIPVVTTTDDDEDDEPDEPEADNNRNGETPEGNATEISDTATPQQGNNGSEGSTTGTSTSQQQAQDDSEDMGPIGGGDDSAFTQNGRTSSESSGTNGTSNGTNNQEDDQTDDVTSCTLIENTLREVSGLLKPGEESENCTP